MTEDMNPTVLHLWKKYGAVLALLGPENVNSEGLARRWGVSRWTVRQLRAVVEEFGAPEGEPEGAIHLVMPDAHAAPGQNLRRFVWFGKLAEKLGREAMAKGVPFRIVSIGDTADYSSLNYYERGKAKSHGKTYPADVKAHEEAMALIMANVSPEVAAYADWIWIEGNHEYRSRRYMNDNPELQGVLNGAYDVMEAAGWETVPFMEWKVLDGVGYCHYMQNPGTGKPVGGVNVARSLVLKGMRSVVVGHNHQLDTYTTTDVFGNPVQALSCGCYFEHFEDYAGQSNARWWRGLCVLRNVKNGGYDLETISMDTLKEAYGE